MNNLDKSAAGKGLMIAVIGVVLQLLVFYVAPQLSANFGVGIFTLVLMLGMYIYFTLELRKDAGGFWTFKIALREILLMAVVAGLVSSVVITLYYKFVEPGAYEKVESYVAAGIASTMEKFGMDQDKVDEATQKALVDIKAQYSPTFVQFLSALAKQLVIEVVMSVIFAAIFKKEPPVFAASESDEE